MSTRKLHVWRPCACLFSAGSLPVSHNSPYNTRPLQLLGGYPLPRVSHSSTDRWRYYTEDHQNDVRAVLQALRHTGLTVKESKCTFSEPRIKLLGYVVSGEGISPDPDKTSALRDMPAPTNVREVRRFLGMAGYYRQLIPMFSHHAAPLVHLTRKHSRFHWTRECQIAFDHLRDVLTSPSIMAHPRIEDPYKLYTDASLYAVGAILTQTDHDGIERPIQYVSKTLSETQQRWSAIEREAFAVVHALKVLRPYLYGAKFEIFMQVNAAALARPLASLPTLGKDASRRSGSVYLHLLYTSHADFLLGLVLP